MINIKKLKKILLIILVSFVVLTLDFIILDKIFGGGFGPGVQDYGIDINDNCELNRTSVHIIYIRCDGVEGKIEEKVIEAGWNDEYIIAKTHPVTKLKYPHNPGNTYKEPDKRITYWWIMDLLKQNVTGPLSEEEYDYEFMELNTTNLELRKVEELKRTETIN